MRRTVEARVVREPEEAMRVVPGTSYRIVPIGTGPLEVAVHTFRLGDIALQVGRTSPLLGMATPDPGIVVLQIPLEHADTLVINGMQAHWRMFGVHMAGAEMLRAGPRETRYAALVMPASVAEAFLSEAGWRPQIQPASSTYATAAREAWSRMACVVEAARNVAAEHPETFEGEQPRRALRQAVLHAGRELVAGLTGGEKATPEPPRAARTRYRIVAAADAYLRAHLDRPIYTDELCDELGISASALSKAFRAVFMISPHRFLKLRRLHMVRAALRDREGPVPLVKSVALSHGFWHLGQFSHDYRAIFGETPSETLAGARAKGR